MGMAAFAYKIHLITFQVPQMQHSMDYRVPLAPTTQQGAMPVHACPTPSAQCFSGRRPQLHRARALSFPCGIRILECSLFQPSVWVPFLGHRTYVNHGVVSVPRVLWSKSK